jgi:hypothetical protein
MQGRWRDNVRDINFGIVGDFLLILAAVNVFLPQITACRPLLALFGVTGYHASEVTRHGLVSSAFRELLVAFDVCNLIDCRA